MPAAAALALLCAMASPSAHEPAPTRSWAARLGEIDELLAARDVDAAASALAPLLPSPGSSTEPRQHADVLLRLARLRRAQGRHADAEAPLRTAGEVYAAIDQPGELGETWRELAGVHWALGRQVDASLTYEQAAHAFARAGRIHDQAGALRSSTYGTRHASREARQAIRLQALALLAGLDDIEPSHRYARGTLQHDIGDAAFADGRYADADGAYRAAEPLLDADVENRRALSLLLTSRGRLERAHGYPDRARPFYERALALQQATSYDDGISQTLNALAVLHQLEGRDIEARDLLRQIVERYAGSAPPWRAHLMRLNAAAAMLRAGDVDDAVTALDAYHAAGGDAQLGVIHRLPEVDILLAAGRLTRALAVADALVEGAEREALAGEFRAQAHLRRATVLQRLARPSAALDDLARASAQWEAMRRTLTASDYVKRGFAEVTARTFYPRYVEALAAAGAPLRALEAAELARARAFADLLAQQQADTWRPPTDAEPPTAPRWREGEGDRLSASDVRSELAQRGASLTSSIAPADVAIDSLVSATPLPPDDMRRVADAERAIVAVYWQGEDETLVWVLRPGADMALHRIAVDAATLRRLVAEAGAPPALTTVRGAPPTPPARRATRDAGSAARARLHALLIAPFGDAVTRQKRLVVVPHGVLARLSFATLVDRQGRYLVERASVRYAPSLTVLQQLRASSPRQPRPMRAVVVGDPQVPQGLERGGLAALPGARDEAMAVAKTLGTHGIASEVLTGTNASESALRASAARADIVHVAAHGIVSDTHPMTSFLALATSGARDDEDGRLTAGEVHGLRLHAELVVLSGCRTADGPVTGDGLSGLTRAFFAAGARTVLASFWDLPDATAERLLPAFYRAWQGETVADKAQALRRAQVRLIGQLRRGQITVPTRVGPMAIAEHPALWGGLAVMGAR
jgi:CHAT domain-containing protein